MKLILTFLLLVIFGASGPVLAAPAPVYAVPGTFVISSDDAKLSLQFRDERGRETAKYDLSGCPITTDASQTPGGDGAFALIFPGSAEPMVAVICHPTAGGQRFSIFAPGRDQTRPIFEITGDRYVRFSIRPGSLVLSRDTDGRAEQEIWHPGVEVGTADISTVQDLMKVVAGRRFSAPDPVDDPGHRALVVRLMEIAVSRDAEGLIALAAPDILLSFGGHEGVEDFRKFIAEPDFWSEFERVLEGGGVLLPSGSGRTAFLPAMFQTWPDDLDAFDYLYGDRPGGQLRAGPSVGAPVIADLHGRFIARGPYLEADWRLMEDGWVHVCTEADGCGYAREEHVRSPIDWRARFTQTAIGAAWVLETYIAGD